jgi:hypothetical protein
MQNQDMGIWPKACDHEIATDVGGLLYSMRQQDEEHLALLLSDVTGEKLGIEWKTIRTSGSFKKKDPSDTSHIAHALHKEWTAERAQEIRNELRKFYGSASKEFPDGTKMRLIPSFSTIISSSSKIKFGT